ncbi:ribonuclease H-like domain-containing protein [Tanacetum coccineum]
MQSPRYSASALERDKVTCRLANHNKRLSPRNTQYPEVDRRSKFAEEILEKAHMQHCNPCKTPIDNESKLGPYGDPVFDSTMYRSLVAQSPDDPLLGILGDNLLSWTAKRHVTVSRSSAEAEYHRVANVVAETAWIRNLLLELHAPLHTATLVYCDNVSVVYLSTNPISSPRVFRVPYFLIFVPVEGSKTSCPNCGGVLAE